MCFILGEIDSRITILTLHFNSMLLVSYGSQIEHQGCWAQDWGKSESVWRLEIWHAMVLFSQTPDKSHGEEVMVRRRAAELQGSLQKSHWWLDSVSRKATFSEPDLRDKEQNSGHCKNKFLEHLRQICVEEGVPKLWEDLEGFDS